MTNRTPLRPPPVWLWIALVAAFGFSLWAAPAQAAIMVHPDSFGVIQAAVIEPTPTDTPTTEPTPEPTPAPEPEPTPEPTPAPVTDVRLVEVALPVSEDLLGGIVVGLGLLVTLSAASFVLQLTRRS